MQDKRSGRSTHCRQGTRRTWQTGVAGRRTASSRQHRKQRRRRNGVPNGKGDEVQTLAIGVGAASSSPSSSSVSSGVTRGHSVTAASLSGRASRRSSPSATAPTKSMHKGPAVRLAELKSCVTMVTALAGAPSPSVVQRSSPSSAAGALAVVLAPVQGSATDCRTASGIEVQTLAIVTAQRARLDCHRQYRAE